MCNLGLLTAGASATITVKVNVGAAATGPLGNSATVVSGVTDPDTSSNTASTSTTVGGPATAIPTLSEWAIVFAAVLLAVAGCACLRWRAVRSRGRDALP